MYSPDEIKKVSLKYCVDLLTNRKLKAEYADVIAAKEMVHFDRMNEVIDNDIEELPIDQYWKIIEMLKKKPGNKYDFTINAGRSYHLALYNLFQLVWRYEIIPEKWRQTTLVQLFKGRGSFNDLDFMRHLHLKNQTFKVFCHIVMSYAKETLFQNMSKYQIACKPGHRPSEHLFVIKSVISLYQQQGQGLLISSFDLRKF